MEQATKRTEVWRTNGRFAPAPKPVEVKPPEPKKAEDGGVIIAMAMGGMSVGVFSIVFYKVTLGIIATAVLAYYINRYIKDRATKSSLTVNYAGKSSKVFL